jgi:RNA polymerase sigma-70 factor (ECF subfamily)
MTLAAQPTSLALDLDEVTLLRASRGDPGAQRALIVRYKAQVHAFIGRMLVGRRHLSLCEDLTHDTFVRVLRALPGFDPRGSAKLSTWILTVASRLCIDELRRREVPLDVASLLEGDAGRGAPSTPLEQAERRRIALAIERAIGDLSPAYRAAFLLREVDGLGYEEIARALDIELGSVRSRLARARAQLQEALADLRPEGRS